MINTSNSKEPRNPLVTLCLEYGKPYSGDFAVGFLAQALGRIPERLPALVVGITIDAVFLGTDSYRLPLVPPSWVPVEPTGQLLFSIGVLLLAYLSDALFDWIAGRSYGRFEQRFLHDIRTGTYDKLQRHNVAYFDSQPTGEILSVLNNDVNNLQKFVGSGLRRIARFSMLIVIAFAFMFYLNWQLATVMIFIPLGHLLVSLHFSKALEKTYDKVRSSVGSLNSQLETDINGITTIKTYAMEQHELRQVQELSRTHLNRNLAAIKIRSLIPVCSQLVNNVGFLLAFVIGGYWVLVGPPWPFTGTVTPGSIMTFLMYARSFQTPVDRLVETVDSYEDAHASSKRIGAVLNTSNSTDDEKGTSAEEVEGQVSYEDVSFTYPSGDNHALFNVSFSADSNEIVGIVGPSGGGKSSLMKLLLRFYDPDSGGIYVDGSDTRNLSKKHLRRQISYIDQDAILLQGTIKENITYGCPDANKEDIRRVTQLVGAHDFIDAFDDGYETTVGNEGTNLSGGQRQLIALSRAVLRDSEILILDEAMNHLDSKSREHIQQKFETITAGRTTFIVAHRLSSVRAADMILVFDDGEIVEQGTHESLIGSGGVYDHLWQVQIGSPSNLSDKVFERWNQANKKVNYDSH